jgi:hypothetical protein
MRNWCELVRAHRKKLVRTGANWCAIFLLLKMTKEPEATSVLEKANSISMVLI